MELNCIYLYSIVHAVLQYNSLLVRAFNQILEDPGSNPVYKTLPQAACSFYHQNFISY